MTLVIELTIQNILMERQSQGAEANDLWSAKDTRLCIVQGGGEPSTWGQKVTFHQVFGGPTVTA